MVGLKVMLIIIKLLIRKKIFCISLPRLKRTCLEFKFLLARSCGCPIKSSKPFTCSTFSLKTSYLLGTWSSSPTTKPILMLHWRSCATTLVVAFSNSNSKFNKTLLSLTTITYLCWQRQNHLEILQTSTLILQTSTLDTDCWQ